MTDLAEHFVLKCRQCKTIIAQCRCPGEKAVRYDLCDRCVTAQWAQNR